MTKKTVWYLWFWADGIVTTAQGYDQTEMMANERAHGKLLEKRFFFSV